MHPLRWFLIATLAALPLLAGCASKSGDGVNMAKGFGWDFVVDQGDVLDQFQQGHVILVRLALEPVQQFQHIGPAGLRLALVQRVVQVTLIIHRPQQIVQHPSRVVAGPCEA